LKSKIKRLKHLKLYQYIKKGLIVGSIVVFVMCACQKNSDIAQSSQQAVIEGTQNNYQKTEANGQTVQDETGTSEAQTETIELEDAVAGESVSQDVFAMDTYMTVTAFGSHAEEAVDQAVAEINRLDTLLSTGSADSEVSKINQGLETNLSEDTTYLLSRSLELYDSTDHVFNIAVYPLMEAWGFTSGNYRVPDQSTLDDLLTYTDVSKINFNQKDASVDFDMEGMKIDLGGIAKGYTSTKIMDIYKNCGVTSGLVNLGGNVQVLGTKTDGSAWRIGIQDPQNSESYLGALSVADKAVITSGGYERYFEQDGKTYHHIIDPTTGYPAENGLISVTIVSADGTLADGLSASLFIMGKDKAIAYWQAHSDEFDMILMDDVRGIYVSEGIADDFTSDLDYEVVKK
jgi:thiamine biosynthesis lipoprotein